MIDAVRYPLLFIFFAAIGTSMAMHVPEIAAWVTNSDQLTLPAFITDMLDHGQPFSGWQLSRATFLFPDALLYLVCDVLGMNHIFSIVATAFLVQLMWLGLVYRSFPRQLALSPSVKVAWTLTFAYGLPLVAAQCSPILSFSLFKYFFSSLNHFTCFVVSVWLLISCVDYVYQFKTSPIWLGVLPLVFFLFTLSNPLIYLYFYIPFIGLFCLSLGAEPAIEQRAVYLFGLFLITALLGTLASGLINKQIPPPIDRFDQWATQVHRVIADMSYLAKKGHEFVVVMGLLFTIYGISLYQCGVNLLSRLRRRGNALSMRDENIQILLTFGGLLNLIAAIPPWENYTCVRYLMFFFFAPIVLLNYISCPFYSLKKLSMTGAFLLLLSVFLASPSPFWFDFFKEQKEDAVSFSRCIKEKGLHRGLAYYWVARSTQWMAHNHLRLVQIDNGEIDKQRIFYYWGNNAYDFLQSAHDLNPIDYIVMDNQIAKTMIDHFGLPSSKTHCNQSEIWLYQDKNQLFSHLIRKQIEPYWRYLYGYGRVKIPAVVFEHQVGQRQALAYAADSTHDQSGYLLHGVAMPLKKGRYRLTLYYQAQKGGEKGSYFFVNGVGNDRRRAVSNHRKGHDSFSFTLHQAMSIEPHVYWGGKGKLRVKNLVIQYIRAC